MILSVTTIGSFTTIAPKSFSCPCLLLVGWLYVVAFLPFNIPLFPSGREPTQMVAMILFLL